MPRAHPRWRAALVFSGTHNQVQMKQSDVFRTISFGLTVCGLLLPVAAPAQNVAHSGEIPEASGVRADGRGSRIFQAPSRAASSAVAATGNGIDYHNGPVMRNGVNIYYIWYGNWAQDPAANAILTDFAKNIGGSPYFAINTTYGDTTGNVQNLVSYVSSVAEAGSFGTSLTDDNVWAIVNQQLASKALPVDPKGVYFVLTAPNVAETSGFLSQFCGFHSFGTYGTTPIAYSFVGHPAANLAACSRQTTSPNGDAAADGMVSILAHELEETATDPQLNAWYDVNGAENGDKCAWNYGTTYKVANGSLANMKLGLRDYLIQQNWLNAGGGSCALSYNPSAQDFSLSVSPTSQTVAPGGTTGNYVVTAAGTGGWSGTAAYSVTGGLPTGATALVAANRLTITTTSGVAAGTYPFTISGTDGVRTHTTAATLVVASPDFSLSVSPASQSIYPGATTGNYTMTASAQNGWSGTVTYSVTAGLPAGATAKVTGNLITVSATLSVVAGSYTFTISGTDGIRAHTANATLVVTAPAFTIAITPASRTLLRPATGSVSTTYTVTVASVGGFTGTVTLAASGATTGLTLALSPTTIANAAGTSTLTVSVTSSARKAANSLTVKATSGSITRSATATLLVN